MYSFIEIWDIKHSVSILTLIDQVFGDILSPIVENSTDCCEDADIEDELDFALHDWNDVIDDDDFMTILTAHKCPQNFKKYIFLVRLHIC